jgi:hypothetical protein
VSVQTKIAADTLHSAMALAFGEIEGATKSATGQVGQQKYKYASLTGVIEAIKPALIKHNLFFTQRPVPHDRGVQIETLLHHASGESMFLGALFVPASKQDAQGFGSAMTYARRYALVTAFGVPVEDDDGTAAVKASQRVESAPVADVADNDTVAQMIGLCEALGGNQAGIICDAYRVSALSELTAKQAAGAIKRLGEKLAERAKETAAQAIDDSINY